MRVLLRKIYLSTKKNLFNDWIDVAEIAYDQAKKTIAVGTGLDRPVRMLSENSQQVVTNKIIDANKNFILNEPPVGTIVLFPFKVYKNSCLEKWERCDGRNLSRFEYFELFDAIEHEFSQNYDENGNDIHECGKFGIPLLTFYSDGIGYFIKAKP